MHLLRRYWGFWGGGLAGVEADAQRWEVFANFGFTAMMPTSWGLVNGHDANTR